MKEHPILFSAPMVKAILDGRKTVTRRAIKAPDSVSAFRHFHEDRWDRMQGIARGDTVRCPYGQPGDRLWVREAWMPYPPCDGTWGYTAWAGSRIGQIAGVPERFRKPEFCNYRATWPHKDTGFIWTPGIHMPRWASRITLEVTGVRVERLQDISRADAIAEGLQRTASGSWLPGPCDYPEWAYHQLWEQINGPGSWEANPWVWVVEFKRLEDAA